MSEADDISRRLEAEGYKALEYTEVDELRDTVECLRAQADFLAAELAKVREAAQKQGVIDGNQITSLAAELAAAREALADVCNPLGKMRRDADARGEVLSGMVYQIANSLAYVQGIAREALLSLPITGHSESGD